MKQYEVYIVNLDPTIGSEIKKTRPCLIVSPNEMNASLRTVQIAPLATTMRKYPWRVALKLKGTEGMVALDQLRTVDKARLVRKTGEATPSVVVRVKAAIREMLVE